MPRSPRSPSAAGPRWRRRKDDRPGEILSAAVAVFAERGYAATRLDDVAARAGVSRATVYLYFRSKEDLFKAVVRQLIVPVMEGRAAPDANDAGSSAERLRRFIDSVPKALESSGLAVIPKLVIAESQNFPELARFYFEEVPLRARQTIAALVRRGIERGEFAAVDPDLAFFCIVAPLFMTVMWRHVFGAFDKDPPDLDGVCRTHLDLLMRGLLKPRSAK